MSSKPSAPGTPQPAAASPLSVEEEDAIIHSRITNDERALRRVIKKFHNYTTVAHEPIVPLPSTSSSSIEDAREAFLVELASFSLHLRKAVMVCEAEVRQVEEYHREQQRIEDERISLRGQIEQLKTSLEHAQMERRQKIEYDLVAEKINTLPNREELEQTIQSLENDMAAIHADHDAHNRLIQSQKSALATIIFDLGSLRLMGKDTETPRAATPAMDAAASDGEIVPLTIVTDLDMEKEDGEEDRPSSDDVPLSASLNPGAGSFYPGNLTPALPTVRNLRSRGGSSMSTPPLTAATQVPSKATEEDDDIEMGELTEEPVAKEVRSKTKVRDEELEEGETGDESSELSDPPDD
ncbi:hypothetical protein EW146_g8606 [Bondarzewia mesenterica]|uniref:Uncharacterized protein n=1 Tax=Bondarzewia mesenterica TaxID=1095465 RepID=A0A4S4LD25_9AGAM|nr:hypothetical protein EW146_g8606 [Bondarzewia mesenterica]